MNIHFRFDKIFNIPEDIQINDYGLSRIFIGRPTFLSKKYHPVIRNASITTIMGKGSPRQCWNEYVMAHKRKCLLTVIKTMKC